MPSHRSPLRAALTLAGALLVATLSFVPRTAGAQVLLRTTAPVASANTTAAQNGAAAEKDEEAPDSPRASMRGFLDLCERAHYREAAHYLDLPAAQEKRGEELARKLHAILGQRLWVDPEQLSGNAHGRREEPLPAGTEELGRVRDDKGHLVPIRIVRHEPRSPDDEARWVFAPSTVARIDALYGTLNDRWITDHLPTPLLAQGPHALYYWQWIALPLLALACVGVGRLLTWLSAFVARRMTAKLLWGRRLLRQLRKPVTLVWATGLFWAALPYLALTLRAEDLIERLLRALSYLAFFWGLLRAVSLAGEEFASADWAQSRPSLRSLSSVGVRLGKVVVAALAFTVALSELGYPVTSIVAGLGIGGVAIALAAQKTVENLFGSVSILADQPFRVGDTIKVDTVEGTVESIGLRSTRLRTADRTLVILPNGKLADMRIESYGPRDRIRFFTKLPLDRRTTPAQIAEITAGARAKVESHGRVRSSDVFVQLTAIGEASFDIEVAAQVETRDFAEFAKVRQELLIALVEIVHEAGSQLAVPTRHLTGLESDLGQDVISGRTLHPKSRPHAAEPPPEG